MARFLPLLFVLALGCSIVQLGTEPRRVDLNRDDGATLAALPGLGPEDAARIIAGRPYATKEDLVRRQILSESQYAAIRDRVDTGPPGMPEYLRSVPPQPEGP